MPLKPAPLCVHDPLTDPLLPTQQRVYDRLSRAARSVPVVAYLGAHGYGRTTLLRRLAAETGGVYVDALTVEREIGRYPAAKAAEVIGEMMARGLQGAGILIFDGFPEVVSVFRGFMSQRMLLPIVRHLSDQAIRNGWRLIIGGNMPQTHETRSSLLGDFAAPISSESFGADDYRRFFHDRLGDRVSGVDFDLLHDLAPMLNLYQLREIAAYLDKVESVDLGVMRKCIERFILRTNLKIREVEALSFDRLPGTEFIAETLETHVVLPLQNVALARELDLTPRRGVLLYGPPGTGKTSIGRALAHRMDGRFFLIDGSFVTEPPSAFFGQLEQVINQAKASAPCVLFIDDADVLFQIEHIAGLSRYLLSLLDGIESESASRVCIMMTAMDAGKLPAPLLRSGRVELWLETKLPTADTRLKIIERWLPTDMPGSESLKSASLVAETEGFTPADLRRLAADAKLLFAADLVAERPVRQAIDYLNAAADDLKGLRTTISRHIAGEAAQARYYA